MTRQRPTFEFQTKARNLAQLTRRLRESRVCDLEILTVADWVDAPARCVERIQKRFGSEKIIVRSSATDEDTADASLAGAFDSCADVDCSDARAVESAVGTVVGSYRSKEVIGLEGQEILIQPMVRRVALSGVLFTRDLGRNLPYYVVNYEESDRTDSITAGTTPAPQRTYRIFKGVDPDRLAAPIDGITRAAQEIEAVTGSDSLDIEFAVDADGHFYLLQVRPLVRTQLLSHAVLDRRLADQVAGMRDFVRERFQPRSGLFGPGTILGEMPDWNPAEIIGTQPKPLAASLYRYIIMDSVWREARGALGYRNPFPHQLLVCVAGRPYVDVRNSFNSFLPEGLSEDLSEKLIRHYLDRLRQHPELHDKVEFEILISCLTFAFEVEEARLREAGFGAEEIGELRGLLLQLTDRAVRDTPERSARFQRDVARLTGRRRRLLEGRRRVEAIPFLVEQLLEDCRRAGTLPFSIAARCAFMATSFLKSLVYRGAMSEEAYHRYMNSIETVAGDFVRDLDRLRHSELSLESFLASYGHLRPGTYDICAPTYAQPPHEYLSLPEDGAPVPAAGAPQAGEGQDGPLALTSLVDPDVLARLFEEFPFGFDLGALDDFIRSSVQEREWLKLEFTKNLSAALDLVAEFGRHHGLQREEMAFLDIDSFLRFSNESLSGEDATLLKRGIESQRKLYELTSTIPLPDLIFSERDVEVVSHQRRKPNFVTQRSVTAPVVHLADAGSIPDDDELRDRIVLTENADPGYDWLFSKQIAGLCTKYGGAASHMTIRCAEFGLPAAIGCGEQIFEGLRSASSVHLDCKKQKVEPHGA